MDFIAEASLWVGGALLIAAALGVWMRLTEIRAHRTIRKTLPTPIASWRPGRGPVAGQGFADETGRVALDPSMLDIEGQSDSRITDTRTVRYHIGRPVPLPSLVPAAAVRDLDSEQWLTTDRGPAAAGPGRLRALGRVRGPAPALAPNERGYSVCTTDNRDQVSLRCSFSRFSSVPVSGP